MRLLPVNSLQPGMKLAKKIYSEEGVILLAENVELTQNLIRRLAGLGLNYVYISDPRTDDIEIPEIISEETQRKAMTEIRSNFKQLSGPALKGFVYPQLGKKFLNVVESILDDLSSQEDVMIMLMNINSADEYLFRHSMNVCIYCLLLGRAYGYSKEELTVIGLGALLHDVGKTQIPADVLMKPGKLTDAEYNQMKLHAELGFKLLKDEPNIPLIAAHCAYQHHERLDGTGYPRGIKDNEIHEYAKWLAIADSYDAMTTHRVYRSAMLPHQAVEVLYAGCGTLYDKKKLEVFRDNVAIYPLGITVKLSTGERGVIVSIDPHAPHRPTVRVLESISGDVLKSPYDLDLAVNLSIVITEVESA